jgi:hypothetical protein
MSSTISSTMSSTMFLKKMLYIPDYVVYEDIPKIIKYFDDFSIAKVKDVQVIPHHEPEYYVEDRYNYGYALIEIDYYYYNQGACNFYNSIETNKGRMVYDDPCYWEVQFSPFKQHNTQLYDVYTINDNSISYYTNYANTNDYNSDSDYSYTSEADDVKKDPDYIYQEEDSSSSDDTYNYESYKKNYISFKTKQNAKRQKLNAELINLKKTLEIIKSKQEQMHALLISNSKSNSKGKSIKKDTKVDWSRRLRIKY